MLLITEIKNKSTIYRTLISLPLSPVENDESGFVVCVIASIDFYKYIATEYLFIATSCTKELFNLPHLVLKARHLGGSSFYPFL